MQNSAFARRADADDALEDQVLVSRARAELPHATAAFDRLVERYYGPTVRLAETLVTDHDDAQSIAQEAMMRVYSALDRFRGDCKFSTWLFRITENLCYSHLARERREREKSRRAMAAANHAQGGVEIGHDVAVSLDDASFEHLVAGLSPEDVNLLALRFIEERELKDIAKIMGLGLSALKMRYYRLLASMREDMTRDEAAASDAF